ncbi:MAG: NHL repeat-containing protein [Candidatus Sericytochromatia bacterium]|nr:NHL repeat-containing protein [Candidatus Sericytochromatia bacterium]
MPHPVWKTALSIAGLQALGACQMVLPTTGAGGIAQGGPDVGSLIGLVGEAVGGQGLASPRPVSLSPLVSPSRSPMPLTTPAVAGGAASSGPAGIVTTLAGDGTRAHKDETGTEAWFKETSGLALAPNGTLYVADTGNHRIRKVTPDGAVTTLAGAAAEGYEDGAGSAARFRSPEGLALALDGTLYVADSGNHRIRAVTRDGVVTTLAGSTQGYADGPGAAAKFNTPLGLALAPDGSLYVADSSNHRLRKVGRGGVVSTLAGSTGGYVDGDVATAKFKGVHGLAVASDGTLYVADYLNQRIRKVAPDGTVTTLAGSTKGNADGPGAAAQFNFPAALALAPDGTVYVADALNHRLRKVTPAGVVSTLAGSMRGFWDATGAAAKFAVPQGLALAPNGTLYVADRDNYRIRLVR